MQDVRLADVMNGMPTQTHCNFCFPFTPETLACLLNGFAVLAQPNISWRKHLVDILGTGASVALPRHAAPDSTLLTKSQGPIPLIAQSCSSALSFGISSKPDVLRVLITFRCFPLNPLHPIPNSDPARLNPATRKPASKLKPQQQPKT